MLAPPQSTERMPKSHFRQMTGVIIQSLFMEQQKRPAK